VGDDTTRFGGVAKRTPRPLLGGVARGRDGWGRGE